MNIHSRAFWGAKPPTRRSPLYWPNIRVVDVHWPADPGTIGSDIDRVAAKLRTYQRLHMGQSRGWSDIAYNMAVDLAGRVWELRGWDTVDGGVKGRTDDFTILVVMGNGDQLTDAAKHGVLAVMDEADRRAGRRLRRTHHGALVPTACPGPQLTRWSSDGFPAPGQATLPTEPPAVTVPGVGGVLKRGSRGDSVRKLQSELRRVFPSYARIAADGDYGPATERAVREFQRRAGITADGQVGPLTLGKLAQHGIAL